MAALLDCQRTTSLGSFRQKAPHCDADFAVFLRKIGGLGSFFPAHVREKTIQNKKFTMVNFFDKGALLLQRSFTISRDCGMLNNKKD